MTRAEHAMERSPLRNMTRKSLQMGLSLRRESGHTQQYSDMGLEEEGWPSPPSPPPSLWSRLSALYGRRPPESEARW